MVDCRPSLVFSLAPVLLFVALGLPCAALAETHSDGDTIAASQGVSGTWSGQLTMTSNVTISGGVTITVQPGTVITVVQDASPRQLTVFGSLHLGGTANDPVTFTSDVVGPAEPRADWQGIVVSGTLSGSHFRVFHAVTGLVLQTAVPAVLSDFEIAYSRNSTSDYGGGMRITLGHHVLTDCYIHDNLVSRATQIASGGGISIVGTNTVVQRCRIEDNEVRSNAVVYGGGISVDGSSTTQQLLNNRFARNRLRGGPSNDGLCTGAGVGVAGQTQAVISGNEFADNTVLLDGGFAGGGGVGLNAFARVSRVDHNYFHDNWTNGPNGCEAGAVLFPFQNAGAIYDNLMVRNAAGGPFGEAPVGDCGVVVPIGGAVKLDAIDTDSATAVAFVHNSVIDSSAFDGDSGFGGAVFVRRGSVELRNNLFVGNMAAAASGPSGGGGALYFDPDVLTGNSFVTVDHNLFFANTLDTGAAQDTGGAALPLGANNVFAAPEFVGPSDAPDRERYQLRAASPARDAAADATALTAVDLLGNSRPVAAGSDMGAMEVLEADLAISASVAPALVGGGGEVSCEITVTLSSATAAPATEVSVTGAALTALSASVGTCSVMTGVCSLGTVATAAPVTVTAVLDAGLVSGPLACAASVSHARIELTPLDNTASAPFTVDASPPMPPAFAAELLAAETSVLLPTLFGTAEPESVVVVTRDDATELCSTAADLAGEWSCVSEAALMLGPNSITATATDALGNTSAASAAAVLTLVLEADLRLSAAVDQARVPGAATLRCTYTVELVSVQSAWAATLTVPTERLVALASDAAACELTTGVCELGTVLDATPIVIEATVAAGESSGLFECAANVAHALVELTPADNSAAAAYEVDATPPEPPSFNTLSTTAGAPGLSGTAEPGALVEIFAGATLVCSTTASDDAEWTCTPEPALAFGVVELTAVATDGVGNRSPPSAAVALTHSADPSPPQPPVEPSEPVAPQQPAPPADPDAPADPTPPVEPAPRAGCGCRSAASPEASWLNTVGVWLALAAFAWRRRRAS